MFKLLERIGALGRSSLLSTQRRLVVVLVLAAVVAVIPASASAHNGGPATPNNSWQGGHWWSSDGCTKSPDWPFLHACIHHDGCYAKHWATRATCDTWFYNDMRATCASIGLNWSENIVCNGSAAAYYIAVRNLGQYFYNMRLVSAPTR